MQRFDSHEELWDYATGVLMGEVEPKEFTLSETFDYRVRLAGETWDGLVDYRVAQVVSELQNTADVIVNEVSSLLPEDKREEQSKLIVKTRVQEGCTDVLVKWGDQFVNRLCGLDDPSLLFLTCVGVIGVSCAGATYFYHKFKNERLDKEIEKAKEENDAERLRQTSRLMDATVKMLDASEKPTRCVVRQMAPEDELKLGHSEQVYNQREAKQLYPRRKHDVSDTFYVDDTYQVTEVKQAKDMLTLVKPGIKEFTASISELNEKDVSQLYGKLKAAKLSGSPAMLSVQVNTKVKHGKPHEAKVIGIASSRTDVVDIVEVVKEKPKAILSKPEEQLPMLKFLSEGKGIADQSD